MASSIGVNRKRSRDDLEDGDDCLPISKRINSLRIEGQTPGISAQNSEHLLSPLAGFCDLTAGCGTPHDFMASPGNVGAPLIPPTVQCGPAARQLDLNSPMAYSERLPTIDEQDISTQSGSSQRHHTSNVLPQFMRSFSEPYSPFLNSNMTDMSMSSEQNSGFDRAHHFPPTSAPLSHQLPMESFQDSQSLCQPMSGFPPPSPNHPGEHFMQDQSQEQFHFQQIPSGPYEPELGVSENPHYYSVNQMLYEAHVSRVRRNHRYPESS
ncbi:uncharacterized protein LOC101853702 [Aplysia californica]|uniref:Uncharacterized protein LOC101853702 n=1 Tax=Aplysia californica TaxID=6500 RepID=A0ABM0JSU2_APLCA|nr:uncharacterized protein LOC101853702 [Aplysia californica]